MYSLLTDMVMIAYDLLIMTIPMMIIGVVVAEFLVAMKVADRIASVCRPLTSFSHLSGECGSSFMMAFVSPKAANAMLAGYYSRGIIARQEMVVASVMNSFPTIIMHWRYLLPVYIPLMGGAGLIYFLLLMFIGFLKTGIIMLIGRLRLKPAPEFSGAVADEKRVLLREAFRACLGPARKTITRILIVTIPVIMIMALLISLGAFEMLASEMQVVSAYLPVPPEGLGIIAAQFGSYIAGASVASALLTSGEISVKGAVLTLLAGNILTSITRTIRWFGTSYAAIFGPRNGAEIMLVSMTLRDGIMLLLIFVLSWVW